MAQKHLGLRGEFVGTSNGVLPRGSQIKLDWDCIKQPVSHSNSLNVALVLIKCRALIRSQYGKLLALLADPAANPTGAMMPMQIPGFRFQDLIRDVEIRIGDKIFSKRLTGSMLAHDARNILGHDYEAEPEDLNTDSVDDDDNPADQFVDFTVPIAFARRRRQDRGTYDGIVDVRVFQECGSGCKDEDFCMQVSSEVAMCGRYMPEVDPNTGEIVLDQAGGIVSTQEPVVEFKGLEYEAFVVLVEHDAVRIPAPTRIEERTLELLKNKIHVPGMVEYLDVRQDGNRIVGDPCELSTDGIEGLEMTVGDRVHKYDARTQACLWEAMRRMTNDGTPYDPSNHIDGADPEVIHLVVNDDQENLLSNAAHFGYAPDGSAACVTVEVSSRSNHSSLKLLSRTVEAFDAAYFEAYVRALGIAGCKDGKLPAGMLTRVVGADREAEDPACRKYLDKELYHPQNPVDPPKNDAALKV